MKKTYLLALPFLFFTQILQAQLLQQKLLLKYNWNALTCNNLLELNAKIDSIGMENIREINYDFAKKNPTTNIQEQLYTARLDKITAFIKSKGELENAKWFDNNVPITIQANSINVYQQQPNNMVIVIITYLPKTMFGNYKQLVQKFRYHTSKNISINAANETVFKFKPFSFITAAGQIVNDYIDISIVEIYRKSDMALYGITTKASNRLLESGGMVEVKASWHGKDLQLCEGMTYQIDMPNNKPKSGMQLFYGEFKPSGINWKATGQAPENEASIEKENRIMANRTASETDLEARSWDVYQSLNDNEDEMYVSTLRYMGYMFTANKLGWINCDHFYDIPNKTNVIVSLPYDKKTTLCLIYKNIHSVVAAESNGKNFYFSDVPLGEEVVIIAFHEDKRKVEFGNLEVKVGSETNYPIAFTGKGEDELKGYLKRFD
jgi:hypothetical protein